MAHSVSAKKRIRQNITHRARNRWRLVRMRTAVKDFRDKALHGTKEETTTAYRTACQEIDRVASKGIIHKNNAARTKSRLNAFWKSRQA